MPRGRRRASPGGERRHRVVSANDVIARAGKSDVIARAGKSDVIARAGKSDVIARPATVDVTGRTPSRAARVAERQRGPRAASASGPPLNHRPPPAPLLLLPLDSLGHAHREAPRETD
ncbi:unnamed protein product [Lampetra fluviatilis]